MNAILGFSQLMEASSTEPPTDRQKEYLSYIQKGGQHLLELIDQVLELSKIEAGRLEVNLEMVEVLPIVEECLDGLEVRAREMDVTLESRCLNGGAPEVFTDPVRLRQILFNFISNAVKYNKRGGHVHVECRRTQAGMLRLCVVDTGDGIPEKKQSGLFEPFNRLGREAGSIEGTGIGLSITRRIAHALGGSVGFQSDVGQGSKF